MSDVTTRIVAQMHTPVRRYGKRPGSLHAARPLQGGAWMTACGELLTDGPRGTVAPVPLREAWQLIDAQHPAVCRRCARVGDSIGGA